jgi:hypothetical protein
MSSVANEPPRLATAIVADRPRKLSLHNAGYRFPPEIISHAALRERWTSCAGWWHDVSISFFTLWDWRTLQRAEHALRIAGDHRQIGASRLIGFSAALFPIAQHALRECDNGQQIPPG